MDAEGRVVALGKDTLVLRLSAALDDPTCNLVIVICDAETKPAATQWTQIQSVLLARKFADVPESIPSVGLVVSDPEDKRVGVWIMPNNEGTGMIEDFLWSSIPEDSLEKLLAEEFVQKVVSVVEKPKFKNGNSKARLYAWLAVQSDPSTHPWQALRFNWIRRDIGVLPAFQDWLNLLLAP